MRKLRSKGKKAPAEEANAGTPDHAVNRLNSVVLSGRTRLRHKKRLLFVVGVAVLAIAAGATYWYVARPETDRPRQASDQSDEDAQISLRKDLINSKDYKATHLDYLILGNAYLEKNNYEAAETAYKQAESLNEADFDVKYALATVYRLQKRRAESLKYYDEAIALASKEDNIYHGNLSNYQAEREAVSNNDFDLKEVEPPSDLPL